jgi:hypothetical protein
LPNVSLKKPDGAEGGERGWYYSSYATPAVALRALEFDFQRTIREHGGRPGLEQFVQKKLRPVSGVMKLNRGDRSVP